MWRLLRSRVAVIETVLNVAMSTNSNKRICGDIARGAAKKLCLREQNVELCSSLPAAMASETMNGVEVMPTPVKSESDKKSYRVIRLSNGLRALLVSDPTECPAPSDPEVMDENPAQNQKKSKEISHEHNPAVAALNEDDEDSEEEDSEGEESDDDDAVNENRQKNAACALCVNVGSFSDPRNIQGLAHFLGNFKFNSRAARLYH